MSDRCEGCNQYPGHPAHLRCDQPVASLPRASDPLVSIQGAADICGLNEREVRYAVEVGKLEPEAVVGSTPVWRRSTVERWDANGRKVMPMSPRLEVVGVHELAARWHVGTDAIKAWRLRRMLPEPDYQPSMVLVWDLATISACDPICRGCNMPVIAVDSRHRPGRTTCLRCECGTWTEMRLRGIEASA